MSDTTKPKAAKIEKKKALKPAQIKELYSIPPSSLHYYCTKLPEGRRLPSFMLPGRGTRCDTRLVYVHELEIWLEKFRQSAAA